METSLIPIETRGSQNRQRKEPLDPVIGATYIDVLVTRLTDDSISSPLPGSSSSSMAPMWNPDKIPTVCLARSAYLSVRDGKGEESKIQLSVYLTQRSVEWVQGRTPLASHWSRDCLNRQKLQEVMKTGSRSSLILWRNYNNQNRSNHLGASTMR